MSAGLKDEVVAFVEDWSGRIGLPMRRWLQWLGISAGKYHAWKVRRGAPNGHNGAQPRHFWRLEWEREAIVAFAVEHPAEGYRHLTYRVLDANVVAVSRAASTGC